MFSFFSLLGVLIPLFRLKYYSSILSGAGLLDMNSFILFGSWKGFSFSFNYGRQFCLVYVTCVFSLATFSIFSLLCVVGILTMICHEEFIIWCSLHFMYLYRYVFSLGSFYDLEDLDISSSSMPIIWKVWFCHGFSLFLQVPFLWFKKSHTLCCVV